MRWHYQGKTRSSVKQPQGKPTARDTATEHPKPNTAMLEKVAKVEDKRRRSTIRKSDFVSAKQCKSQHYKAFVPKDKFEILPEDEYAKRIAEIQKRQKTAVPA